MTTNFVNVFRHFGPNAEKVLLGKLGLKFGKEYFFEYDENYVSSFPNPSLNSRTRANGVLTGANA